MSGIWGDELRAKTQAKTQAEVGSTSVGRAACSLAAEGPGQCCLPPTPPDPCPSPEVGQEAHVSGSYAAVQPKGPLTQYSGALSLPLI